ncbi:VOC family protein [Rhizobium sp. FKL33]|uniref:VOC family protein n=1 Tax=Rhizobium sp. FKL33 TaxID=2562307 RepID=UPI0010BFE0FB|nr:VOC family protein [Rhizobium sp. FKL33]
METEALALARSRQARNLPERLSYGPIELSVTNLDRAVRFWTTALGFVPRPHSGPGVALGAADRTLVVLHPGASVPAAKGYIGLYHAAFGMPTQAEFSRMMLRLRRLGMSHAPVDHLMSKAIYLNDPDGHGIEIAFETPERFGRFLQDSRHFAMLDADGNLHSGREPLDIPAELAMAGDADITAPVADGTVLAHLHFHVPGLDAALVWFERLGFARNLYLPQMGIADMGAGAAYTHRLAMNLWAGPHAKPAPSSMARLLRYSLETADADVFESARRVLTPNADTGALSGLDPAGVTVELTLRQDEGARERAA